MFPKTSSPFSHESPQIPLFPCRISHIHARKIPGKCISFVWKSALRVRWNNSWLGTKKGGKKRARWKHLAFLTTFYWDIYWKRSGGAFVSLPRGVDLSRRLESIIKLDCVIEPRLLARGAATARYKNGILARRSPVPSRFTICRALWRARMYFPIALWKLI